MEPAHAEPGTGAIRKPAARAERLAAVFGAIARRPWQHLLRLWSWKAMLVGAALRALLFVIGNRHGGSEIILRVSLVEALYALPSDGLSGALTQRIALAEPQGAVATVVWCVIPLLMLAGQLAVHRLAATPHMKTGVIGSLIFAALGSGFTWFAMRRGVLLAGTAAESVEADARRIPRLIVAFVAAPFIALRRAAKPTNGKAAA